MSLPTPLPPVAPMRSARTARLLNVATTMLLATSLLLVGIAAGPSVLRAVIYSGEAEPEAAPPLRVLRPRLAPRDHPPPAFGHFPGSDDDGDIDSPPDSPPDSQPPRGSRNDPRVAPPGDDDNETGLGLGLKGGITLRPLLLRDRRSGEVLQQVRAGENVSILRDDEDWILIVHKNKEGLVTGWAKKSELLLR